MEASARGELRDFVAVGDVEIKVIGADSQFIDTQVPVRQILEQMVAKTGLPPFLLGLSWSTTERMSAQQADLLTSELESYRKVGGPRCCRRSAGCCLRAGGDGAAEARVVWDNISLQDETELAQARLMNAQAAKLEIGPQERREADMEGVIGPERLAGTPPPGAAWNLNREILPAGADGRRRCTSSPWCSATTRWTGTRSGFPSPPWRSWRGCFLGRTGIFDHDPKGEGQTARIFATALEEDPAREAPRRGALLRPPGLGLHGPLPPKPRPDLGDRRRELRRR